jgi:uncharacterized membrane protein
VLANCSGYLYGIVGNSRTLVTQMIHPTRIILTATLSLFSVLSGQAQPLYTVTDLGNLGFGSSNATCINNRGEVGGNTQGIAFLYDDGAMHDIGAGVESSVWELNDRGEAIGTAGAPNIYYFIYTGGKVHPLTNPNSNVAFTNINNSGKMIGYNAETYADVGFRYINGIYQPLGTLNGLACTPYGINSQGQIVGSAGPAFLYDNGHIKSLGSLGSNALLGVSVDTLSPRGVGRAAPTHVSVDTGSVLVNADSVLTDTAVSLHPSSGHASLP